MDKNVNSSAFTAKAICREGSPKDVTLSRNLRRRTLILLLCGAAPAFGQTPVSSVAPPNESGSSTTNSPLRPEDAAPAEKGGFWKRWFARVTKTQAAQPHWITPLATTTPRLEEEFRYDIAWQLESNGVSAENFGLSKGLELIPAGPIELIFSVPPYVLHSQPNVADGFGDVSFLLKYRLLTANEDKGNYILTVFLGASAPTGHDHVGAPAAIITPTIAFGKGWGNFDVQSTFGATLPVSDSALIGHSLIWNTAFQFHVLRKLWPELEVNSTFFLDGPRAGLKQTFLTPGIVVGRIHLWHRLGLSIGTGVQIAVTRFHINNHNWIFSARFPF